MNNSQDIPPEQPELDYDPELAGMLCDPPTGWLYGFPQLFTPKPGQTLANWLIEQGYPSKDAQWAAKHTRFIG